MSWSPRRLSVLLLAIFVLGGATGAQAGPLQPARPASTDRTVVACSGGVCEYVTGTGTYVETVKGTASPTSSTNRCGQFTLTVRGAVLYTKTSPRVCAVGTTPATYTFVVRRSFPTGSLVCMTFSNPGTPGRPCVRLPLL